MPALVLSRPADRATRGPSAIAVVLAVLTCLLTIVPPARAEEVGVGGSVFHDVDRDGVLDADDEPWGGQAVVVHDADGAFVGSAMSDDRGAWSLAGLAPGTYVVAFGDRSWEAVRDDWVPTTIGGVWPEATVAVTSTGATIDFGWRQITRSDSLDAPLSRHTTPDGVLVESYTDAVTASAVAAHLDAGSLRGGEAAFTSIRFGYDTRTRCSSSVGGLPGSYAGFSATCSIAYLSWLVDRDRQLFHEYGHAWANYHDTIVQQEGDLASYLEFRGLTGDARLGTSHGWQPDEMIAEDYRQLFGSPSAAAHHQENQDITPARDVPGLADWLRTTFMTPPAGDEPDTQPDPEPGDDPTDEPVPATPLAIDGLAATPGLPTTISGHVTTTADVSIAVADSRGRAVRALMVATPVSDAFSVTWHGLDDRGRQVRPGTYLVTVRADDGTTVVEASIGHVVDDTTGDGADTTGPGKGNGRR